MFIIAWVLSIIGTIVIADRKNLNIPLYFFLSLLFGPLALLIAAVSSPRGGASTQANSSQKMSVEDAKQQLEGIKTSLRLIQQRVERIESALGTAPSDAPQEAAFREQTAASPQNSKAQTQNRPEAFEFIFGKYWLNRIGVVLFVVGIGLFINYTFHYFSAFVKIAIGYFFAALFLIWGQRLEKNPKLHKLAWGILGGAWGLFYLVTYAMHYVPATRVVTNPLVELVLLSLVTVFAVQYNLKYKSWIATAMSYLLGFITMAIAGVDTTSVFFWAILLGSLAYLSYVFDWDELLTCGTIGAYVVYLVILRQELIPGRFPYEAGVQFQLAMSLLAAAWVIFFATVLAKQYKTSATSKGLLQIILFNTSAFAFLGLWEIGKHLGGDDQVQYAFLLVLAIVHCLAAVLCRFFKKPSYIVVHGAIAITLASWAVLIRFPQLSVSFWWILEMLTLFMLGVYYQQNIYRCMGWLLGVGVMLRFFAVDLHSSQMYSLGPLQLGHDVIVAVVAAAAFFLLGMVVHRPVIGNMLERDEKNFYFYTFPAAGALVLASWMADHSPSRWLTLHWALLGIGLLLFGFFYQHRAFRFYALGLLVLACGRILLYDLSGVDTIYKIIVVIFLGAALLGVSLVYSRVKQNN